MVWSTNAQNADKKIIKIEDVQLEAMLDDTNFANFLIDNCLQRLGAGLVSPVAYDTAWLARLPDFPNTSKPAFPEALNWLRNNQLPDGSWGSAKPFNAHDSTLSTFAAILALAQWQQESDSIFIEKGLIALKQLAPLLAKEAHETIGFELLLFAFIDECNKINLKLPAELDQYYQPYKIMNAEKRKLIQMYSEKYGKQHPASWWFNLEMLGGYEAINKNIPLELGTFMLSDGSVAASPAATAYLLTALRMRGQDSKEAFAYLKQLVGRHNLYGYLPNVAPIDEFELAFSVNYFLEAGISPTDFNLDGQIKKIAKMWQRRKEGGIGYSSHFFIDPDCSATAMHVLSIVDNKPLDPKVLLNFFNGSHIETYKGERSPSVSANLHVVYTLSNFMFNPEVKSAVASILNWLEKQAQSDGPIFTDKWHSSFLYPISRAVIALKDLKPSLAERCVAWLLANQHADGGWGMHNYSTPEESGFASLALAVWQQKYHTIPDSVLNKAQHYLQNCSDFPKFPLWIGKVLYCPELVVDSIVAAACYALNKQLMDINFAAPGAYDYIEFNLGSTTNPEQLTLRGTLLCTAQPFKGRNVDPVEEQMKEWAIKFALCKPDDPILKAGLPEGSASAFREADLDSLKIYTDYVLFLLVLDDVLDESWQGLGGFSQIEAVFADFLLALKDPNCSLDQISQKHKFPKIASFVKALADLRTRILQKSSDIHYFLLSIQALFAYLLKEYQLRHKAQLISSQAFADIRLVAGGMQVTCELAFLLQGIKIAPEFRETQDFKKLIYHGNKALIIANDLLSLLKEVANGCNGYNYVLLKKNERKLSLQDAFDECLQDYNNEIIEFFKCKASLLHLNKELKSTVAIIENHIQAHVDWALSTIRYRVKGSEIQRHYSDKLA